MAARSIASATVTFGLVSIPVRLYSATEPGSTVSFNLLHAKDGARVRQQYICSKDGEVVPRDEMVKGYEFAKDRYVTFTPEELKAIEEQSTQAIEITEFVPIEKIDPIYFEKAYYLGPDKGGDKAYRLLAKAMQETGRSALGKYAARGKQYLVMLRPLDGRLVMQQLHHAGEVRPATEIPDSDASVRDSELKLAVQLVDQISTDEFRPEDYKDEVRERVQALIDKKVEGEDIAVAPPETPKGARIIDLMEALKASLSAPKERKEAAEERRPARRAPQVAARSNRRKTSRSG